MEIVNNTETERLRAAVNEALNPEEANQDAIWRVAEEAKSDLLRFRYHGRGFTRGMPDDPELTPLIEEHLRLMESYFNNAKEMLRTALAKLDDGWQKAEYEKYLTMEFTPTWGSR